MTTETSSSADSPQTTTASATAASSNPIPGRGRWKIAVVLLLIACVAQAFFWTKYWEDPTHFKMSVLFVWPAALFSLLIWWTFFSGWSGLVRFGSVGLGVAGVVGFFTFFKLDRFDGDMVPTRVTWAWKPDQAKEAREYLQKLSAKPSAEYGGSEETNEVVSPAPIPTDADWPGFRGINRDGVLRTAIRTDWNERPVKELWRHPVGKGWSSFAVVGDMAFTQEERPLPESSGVGEAVVAYNLMTGDQLWMHLGESAFPCNDAQGGPGPRATPTYDQGRLYVQGAAGELSCLDARTGKLHWSTNILKDAGKNGQPVTNLEWGMSGSPLIVDDLVIAHPGGDAGRSVIAYHKETGKQVWAAGNRPSSYGSPSVTKIGETQTLLIGNGTGLSGHSLETGAELWFFPWECPPKVNSALPLVLEDNSILFGCGYGIGTVRIDVKQNGNQWFAEKRWHSNRFRPKFNDFVVTGDHCYGLDDGTLTCLEVATGKLKWKSGRYGYGQILLAGETLVVLSEEGQVLLIPATPTKPDVLHEFKALDGSITWNHPVIAHDKLLVRNGHEAACFDLE